MTNKEKKPQFKIGDHVRVYRLRSEALRNCLVGFEGFIREVDLEPRVQVEFDNGAKPKYTVHATNFGGLARSAAGNEKKVYKWVPGNKTIRWGWELELCTPPLDIIL